MRKTLGLALAFSAALSLGACKNGDKDGEVRDTAAASAGTATGTVESNLKVTDVKLGRTLGTDNQIADATNDFKPNDTIIAVVETDGSANGQALVARWTYQDGQVVEEQTQTVSSTGSKAYTQFRLSKPSGWPLGKYKLQVMMNNNEVESEDFEVKR